MKNLTEKYMTDLLASLCSLFSERKNNSSLILNESAI